MLSTPAPTHSHTDWEVEIMLLGVQEHKTGEGGHAQQLQGTLHPPGKCCYPPIPCCPILSPCSKTGLQQFSLRALFVSISPLYWVSPNIIKKAIIFPILQRESFLHHAFLFPASLFPVQQNSLKESPCALQFLSLNAS